MSGRRLWSRLSIPQGIGTIAGWLRTWDNFQLQIDSTSWNSLESFTRFTRSCTSCICDVSSWKVAWFSLTSCLENSSIRISWALSNSSPSWTLLTWVSRSALSRCVNSSWSLACSLRDVSYPRLVWSIYIRLEWICLWSSRMEQSRKSALNLFSNTSDFASASRWSFCSSRTGPAAFSDSESLDRASSSPWIG